MGKIIKNLIISGLVIAGALKLWQYLRSAEHFNVKQIEVRGAFFLPAEEVRRLAGIKSGENLFDFRPRQIEKALTVEPWISRVRVRRLVPDRVTISIQEREPLAIVAGNGLFCLSQDGVLMSLKENACRLGLPVLRGLNAGRKDVGQKLESFALANLLKRMTVKGAPFSLREFSEVTVGRSGYQLVTLDALVIKTGLELEKSMLLLTRALKDARARDISFNSADTRVEGQVILN